MLVAGGIIMLIGALDDRFELDSLTKFAGQVTAAGVLVLYGVQWFIFWVPWNGGAGWSARCSSWGRTRRCSSPSRWRWCW